MKRTQQGITLIALVITIIVLLILAGITINLVMGKNGIFNISQYAVQEYNNKAELEKTQISELSNTMNENIYGTREDAIKSIKLDYTNKIRIDGYDSEQNVYTVPSTGIIVCTAYTAQTDGYVKICINDLAIWVSGYTAYTFGGYSQLVTTGDQIYCIKSNLGTAGFADMYFIPFR